MIGRPDQSEAAPYYWTYINEVPGDSPLSVMDDQYHEAEDLFHAISDEKST